MSIKDILGKSINSEDSLDDVFEEEPVDLQTFVSDDKFFRNNMPLSPVQYAAVRHIERIYFPELYPKMGEEFGAYWAEPIRMVNHIVLQWGKGSGKDFVCQIAAARVAYLLICLKSPQVYFNIAPHSTIHLLNVAPASALAHSVFFAPLARVVSRGWFEDKCDVKNHAGIIEWSKNVESISGHADADAQEGMNLLLGIADEIDAFKTDDEFQQRGGNRIRPPTKSAESLLDMFTSSGTSRFKTFKSVQISFPRYIGSTIQLATKKAYEHIETKKDKSNYYASGPLATWEVNPIYDTELMVPVPGNEHIIVPERLLERYEDDILEAQAKYECKPSPSYSPFFRNKIAVEQCFFPVDRQPIDVTYKLVNKSGSVDGMVWEPEWDFDPNLIPIAGAQYVMHGDLSTTQDRAGIAMAHCVNQETYERKAVDEAGNEVIVPETRPNIKIDFVVPFTSDMRATPAREIRISWARELAMELKKRGFNIVLYTFDGYQSLGVAQDLMEQGIPSNKVSTDRGTDNEAYKNLRDLMYENRIKTPYNELLLKEILSLTKLANGKIDHPANFSKDQADAAACAALGAVKVGGQESPDGERAYYAGTAITMGPKVVLPVAYRELGKRGGDVFAPISDGYEYWGR